jgi:hypothetical protein
MDNLTKEQCIGIIKEKYKELGRIPKKSDFSDYQVMKIKSYFGPWPRAMEGAGVKAPRTDEKLLKKQEKHLRQKERKAEYKRSLYENNKEKEAEKS